MKAVALLSIPFYRQVLPTPDLSYEDPIPRQPSQRAEEEAGGEKVEPRQDPEAQPYPYSMWQQLVIKEEIRDRFLNITPEDIGQMSDIDSIRYWENVFWVNSQPQSEDEYLYCDLMRQACRARCVELTLLSPSSQV